MRFSSVPKNLADIRALERAPLNQYITANTSYEIIRNVVNVHGDKTAIIFLQQGNAEENPVTISYQNLLNRINQAANLFSSLHATNGNVVSYLLPNFPQTHFVLWGAEAVGIVNPLRPDLSAEQIANLLQKANSKTIVTIGEFIAPPIWQNILKARELYPELKTIFVIGGKPNHAQGIYDFEESLNAQSMQFIQPETLPDAVCAYFHTSATTTPNPKLVSLTQCGQVYAAWAMGTCLGYQENDVVAVGLPFFHVGAPMVGGLVSFICGATTVMMSPMGWLGQGVVENFWKIVERYHVTVTAALNFTYSQLLRVPGIENTSLRLAISGTSVLRTEFDVYEKAGIRMIEIYGSSETMMASFNPVGFQRPGSMGLRFPYEQMKVMKTDGRECAANEVGELWISGPNLTKGYRQGSQNSFLQDGWFKTGDLVHQDQDGYFWFFDRTADVINSKTGAISSLKLEKLFEIHPKIDRAAVIGQPDSQHGEVPILYVTVKPNCELTIPELQQWTRENISEEPDRPTRIIIEERFPLNGIAKVVKPIIREKNIVGLYSRILDKLFVGTDTEFKVKTNYDSDDKMIAEITIHPDAEQHEGLIFQIKNAFENYLVPIMIKVEEKVMSYRI